MQPYNLITLALTLFVTDVFAIPAQDISSAQAAGIPEGYIVGQLRVTGEVNGIAVNHTGTVQEIFKQLETEDNSFKLSDLAAPGRQNTGIHLPSKREMTDVKCLPVPGQKWNGADVSAIDDGIYFLKNRGLTCNVGPHSCVRVSCSWDGGIYVCNNGDNEIRPSCNDVGIYAQALVNNCRYKRGFLRHDGVGGQVWDNENWNVVVRKDGC
ncbi:hypothetical protein DL95DRAFT_492705 [Leptodontidium sp. 2 PMI_412]|nr:hypothetical protein DL95DRAFT_492705 [Leptodontidium sp. 2 PMI_412]